MQLTHPEPSSPAPWSNLGAASIGYAEIVHRAYAGDDLSALTRDLVARASGPVVDAGALLDLATVLQLQGGDLAVEGRLMQRNALHVQRSYVIRHGTGQGPRILAFVTAGDFMTNTPIDFLLRGSDAVLILHFVDATTESLTDLLAHDAAFMAIGEAPENAPVLQVMARLLQDVAVPVFNRNVAQIARLDRVSVSDMLSDELSILAPKTLRVAHDDFVAMEAADFPLILRPIGSHAGAGLCKIDDAAALMDWLRLSQEAEAYVAPFVDYRGADGFYTKARVVQICGRPYASHLAQSPHWMVHYLNANMAQNPDRRAAEAAWMARFDLDFAQRHAAAFAALYQIIGLEYFGIDCAELPDGRLLVFEADVAMIVHDMDDAAVFPYKKPVMQKLFAGFLAALTSA
jgi:glutathione synthase/RimK-type ligase-like ATP-grasp enzyme